MYVIISCEVSDKISDKEICQQFVHTSRYNSVTSRRTQTNNDSNLEGSNLLHDKQHMKNSMIITV